MPERDVVLLRQVGRRDKSRKVYLSPPIESGTEIKLGYGATISGSSLIGREILDVVQDSTGRQVDLREPSLSSYVLLARRRSTATPVCETLRGHAEMRS